MNATPAPMQDGALAAAVAALRAEVARHFVGPEGTVELLLVALLGRGHALIEGVPGVAKTTLMRAFAAGLGCGMRRIQFTPDLLPADITGSFVFSPRDGSFSLRPGPVFSQVVLADEINRAPAKTQSALLEAMQEAHVTIEGERYALPQPFFVVATQNPSDMEGTYPLPEAQLDRFMVSVALGYPSAADEVRMLRLHGAQTPPTRAVLQPEQVEQLRQAASAVHVDDDLLHYVVSLTQATRSRKDVLLGASPRASLALLQASKARALLHGRSHVSPDDVRALAPSVLAHRLIGEDERDAAFGHAVVQEVLARTPWRRGG